MEISQVSCLPNHRRFMNRTGRLNFIAIMQRVKNPAKLPQGLTLIEVLIALAIVSIAITAAIKASTQTINSTRYLQQKTIATWAGEQIINEARLGIIQLPAAPDTFEQTVNALGQHWYIKANQAETPNKRIWKLNVAVYEHEVVDDETPLVTLTSYRYDQKSK
jgi:general secretion pathway protein I